MVAALFLELAERIRAATIPNIVYRTSKKNGLPMFEQAKLLSFRLGTGDYFKIFDGIFPPLSNKVVFTGYVLRFTL